MRYRPASRALVPLLSALVALAGCDDLEPVRTPPGLPAPPAPPPLEADLDPIEGPVRIEVTDVDFQTATDVNPLVPAGVEVMLPRVEAIASLPPLAGLPEDGTALDIRRLRLEEPRITFPPDTVVTEFNLFFSLFGPGVAIDTLIVDDGEFGTLAAPGQAPGRWFWRIAGVDFVFEDILLGDEDGLPEQFDITRFAVRTGEIRGRPIAVEALTGGAFRTEQRLTFDLDLDLGLSRIRVDGYGLPTGAWSLDIAADTLRFAELQAMLPALPDAGTGEAELRIRGRDGEAAFTIDGARARIGRSLLALRGTYSAIDTPELDDVVLQLAPLYAEDLETIADVGLPVGGRFDGRVRADGDVREGIGLDARLTHREADDAISRVALGGTVRLEPTTRIDVDVTGDPVTAGGRAYTVDLTARGPPDSVAVRGRVAVTKPRPVFARLDALVRDRPDAPPRLSGTAVLRAAAEPTADVVADDDGPAARDAPIRARAEGAVVLSETGAVDVRIVTDDVPLALLPSPDEIEDVRGSVSGAVDIGGTVADPTADGRFRVRGAGFRVPAADLRVSRLGGPIRLEDGVARVDRLEGRVNGGRLVVDGTVDPADGAGYDLAVDVSGAVVEELPEGDVLASADLRVIGPLDAPRVRGRVVALGPPAADGLGLQPRLVARGVVVATDDGPVDVRIEARDAPLGLLPVPAEVERVTGYVEGAATVGGTLDEPTVRGRFRLADGGFTVPRYGFVLREAEGPIVLREDAVVVPRIAGRAGAGTIVLSGRVVSPFDSPRLDLAVDLDRARVANTDSIRVVASGGVDLAGPVERPRFDGRVTVVEGFIYEDQFRPVEPLDIEDPPYAELAREVPWPEDSPLLRAPEDDPPLAVGVLTVEVTPDFHVIDEDSDMFGRGEVRVVVDDEGLEATGTLTVLGGFYAFFGHRFEVVGGAVVLPGGDREPRIGLVAVQEESPTLGAAGPEAMIDERFTPLEFFAHGPISRPVEELRRLSLHSETQEELAALLIYDLPPVPVTGWRYPVFWRATEPEELLGERGEAQAMPLLWSYVADEMYDYLPIAAARFQAGTVTVGPRYPARLVVAPVFRAAAALTSNIELILSQPLEGEAGPGLRARLHLGDGDDVPAKDGFVEAFIEPRYYADAIGGDGAPGFFIRTRIGIGAGWAWVW